MKSLQVPISHNGVYLGEWTGFNPHLTSITFPLDGEMVTVVYQAVDVEVDGGVRTVCRFNDEDCFHGLPGSIIPREWLSTYQERDR